MICGSPACAWGRKLRCVFQQREQYFQNARVGISAIVDAGFSLIVDGETASRRTRRGGAQANRARISRMKDAELPPKSPSHDLLLNKLPPDQRAQVIRAAAVLLVSKAAMNKSPAKRFSAPGMLAPAELESLRARLRPQDRDRLRPDGLLEPVLPPWTLCGGLESPYLIAPASPDSASPQTSSASDRPPSSAA